MTLATPVHSCVCCNPHLQYGPSTASASLRAQCLGGPCSAPGAHVSHHTSESCTWRICSSLQAPSGVMKERMQPDDMFVLDSKGDVLHTPAAKPPPARPPKLSECSPLFMAVRARCGGLPCSSQDQCCTMLFGHVGRCDMAPAHSGCKAWCARKALSPQLLPVGGTPSMPLWYQN